MNVIITAGGTSEYIDKVRKITNSGTGKLGATIADKLAQRNDINTIFYICSENSILPHISLAVQNHISVKVIKATTTMQVKEAVEKTLKENKIDWFIHSMAISDYYVDYVSTATLLAQSIKDNIEENIKNPEKKLDNSSKISSNEDNLVIVLKQTPKIIKLIKEISPKTHLIGFKLLENVSKEELIKVAKNLMAKNNCDYVVANDLKDIKEGNHKAYIVSEENITEVNGKPNIAKEINRLII